MPRPISGSRFAPKMMMTMARMTSSSGSPIRPMMKLLTLLAVQKQRGERWNGLDCTTRRAQRGIAYLVGFLMFGAVSLGPVSAALSQFASGVDLVEVYATVTDARGEPVAGLAAADFRVLEDDPPQKITTFAAGDFPLAVAIR